METRKEKFDRLFVACKAASKAARADAGNAVLALRAALLLALLMETLQAGSGR